MKSNSVEIMEIRSHTFGEKIVKVKNRLKWRFSMLLPDFATFLPKNAKIEL